MEIENKDIERKDNSCKSICALFNIGSTNNNLISCERSELNLTNNINLVTLLN